MGHVINELLHTILHSVTSFTLYVNDSVLCAAAGIS
mgnify:CR=1 FL=1